MKFTVVWNARVFDELAAIWVDARTPECREAITGAADAMEVQLRRDAHEKGESRGDGMRIGIFLPLVFDYFVSEADRKVTVVHVRTLQR